MNLTPEQFEDILKVIDKYTQAMVYIMVGGQKPPIELLLRVGASDKLMPMITNAYVYGKLENIMKQSQFKSMTFEKLKKEASKVELTSQERFMLNWARQHAARYIGALANTFKNKVMDAIETKNKESLAKLSEREVIKDEIEQAIINRKSKSDLVSKLREATGDVERDWHRVAHTELWNAKLNGQVMSILSSKDGGDTFVYRKPRIDACDACKKLYLEEDGVTPKVFKLRDLLANGDNYGRKYFEWLPVVGTTHPNCACTLNVLPKGFGFNDKGEVIYKGRDKYD